MAYLTLPTTAYLVPCLLLGWLVWRYIRLPILTRLYPQHYSVWAGTQRPPTASNLQAFRYIIRLFLSENKIDYILEQIFGAQTRIMGTTFSRAGKDFFTIDPANLQALLATQFHDFETGSTRRAWLYPLIGDSIFTSDGAFWEHSRALFRPQFARENINDLEMTEQAAKALIAACGNTNLQGWTADIDLSPLFYNFTLDTATDFLFGESMNSQALAIQTVNDKDIRNDARLRSAEEFRDSLELISYRIMWRMTLGPYYYIADGINFRKAIRYVRSVTERYVQLALTAPMTTQSKGEKSNMLSALATRCKDPRELRNQTLAIMFAGRDTTAALLGWVFRELAVNPDVFNKLRKIILNEFPTDRAITFAQLKSCRYLQHVINESLRLHPTVPLNTRIAVKDTTLPCGGGPDGKAPIAVQKNQPVIFSVYAMHRREDLWGPDAAVFRPERWEERIPAWQFLPFLGGPRICLGQQFALTEIGYLLVRMLQHFDRIDPVDYEFTKKMPKQMGVTLAVKGGVHVRLHAAAS